MTPNDESGRKYLEKNQPRFSNSSLLPSPKTWAWQRPQSASQPQKPAIDLSNEVPIVVSEDKLLSSLASQPISESLPLDDDMHRFVGARKQPLPPLDDITSTQTSSMPELHHMCMKACEEFQYDLEQCIFHGGWKDRLSMCQTVSGRFWKCLDDYKLVLIKMGYDSPNAADEQRKKMLGESIRIVETVWAMENRPDMLERGHGVIQLKPADAETTSAVI